MRLIDADALIVSECRQCDGDCHCFDGQKCLECNSHNKCQLREAIDYADTVDAIPVVRCRDCKHWGTDWALGETEYVKCCEFGQYMVGANGYCVYGEVKNNGG